VGMVIRCGGFWRGCCDWVWGVTGMGVCFGVGVSGVGVVIGFGRANRCGCG
jgi:hypothetical protein